jgi:transposase
MVHIGLDMHKESSEVAVIDDSGAVLDRCRLYYDDLDKLALYFRQFGTEATVTIEATRGWYWLVDLLQALGLTVKLANPKRVRLIADAQVKTDKIDAWVLAHLERLGFLPECYIPPLEVRGRRELLRHRLGLVRMSTAVKARVHALLAKLGFFPDYSDLFGKAGRQYLAAVEMNELYRRELDSYLVVIDLLAAEIKKATVRIRTVLKEDPRAELIQTAPGIGVLTAHLLLSEIGDVGRFRSPKRLCSYGGLVPRTYQSGNHVWQGELTQDGNRYIRYAMVEAAQQATKRDPGLRLFYERLRREKGNAKARVAVAHKLLVSVYYILKRNEPYHYRRLRSIPLGKPEFVLGHTE